MSDAQDRKNDEADTSRAVAFSDGIFAIIITLLVLDLQPPEAEPGQLLSGLLRQWPTYLAYLTSYLYVAVVWLNHKGAFRRIRSTDRGLHWVNFGVLFTTALLPFPTAVISATIREGNLADEQTAVALYALIGALLCASWLAFYHYLSQHPELVEENAEERHFHRDRTKAIFGIVLYTAAGVLGYLTSPLVGLIIFLILPVFYALTSEGIYKLPAVLHQR